MLEEVLPQNNSFDDFDVEHEFPDIGRKSMLLNARRLPPWGGDGRLILLSIEDVTARRRTEQQAHHLAQELANTNRRKDEFLAMLSHELRSPLAPIANAVYLLRAKPSDNPFEREASAVIERQLTHLTRLVEDLLEVSRITTGRIRLREERLVLNGIVASAVEMVRPLMDKKGHNFTLSLPPEPIWVYGDAERLGQVLTNLLTNAAKYTEKVGRISLDAQQERMEVIIRVRDTGIGIAPELLPRVFDLFTQAEQGLARAQGGLGVGLTLARTLTELHGGNIEALSEGKGKGSEFIVRLPAARPPEAPPELPPDVAAEQLDKALIRVLLVDDSVDMTLTLGRVLQTLGHEIHVAHSGAEALSAAIKHRPDVVLLDIGLPDIDGYEVAKRMRAESGLQHVVMVAMTGYGREEDRRRSQEAGFRHHLVKPADVDAVQSILTAVAEAKAGQS